MWYIIQGIKKSNLREGTTKNYNKKTIEDIEVSGKRVLVRCDFNVPVKNGVITDEKRIIGALPTIKYLMEKGAKVILCSHMGRPHNVFDEKLALDKKEKKKIEALPEAEQEAAKAAALEKAKDDVTKLSLQIVADALKKHGVPAVLAKDVVGPDAKAKAAALKDGEVLLLENIRFHAAEEKNDPDFAKALASMAEIYVNDAFGTAHRAHASTAGVADYLPAVSYGKQLVSYDSGRGSAYSAVDLVEYHGRDIVVFADYTLHCKQQQSYQKAFHNLLCPLPQSYHLL